MRLINLIPLHEIDFPSQAAFDTYSKNHKLRPTTKVKIAGKTTTAGQASKVKGTSVFGGDKKPDVSLNGISTLNKSKPEDLVPSVENHLNKVSGGNGYAQIDDGSGAIAYNMGDGDMPTYTLYMGKEFGKHRVSLEPTYGNDPKKLQGKIDKSFDKAEDAIKFMGDVAKKHRKELEMDDNKKSDDKSGDYPVGSLQYRLQKNNPKDAVKYDNQLKATIKDIADLTDNNDHNGAVMALAKMMGDKSSTVEMEKIQKYHNSKGHMPQSLIKYRSSILNNLLAQAKKKYGDKVAKQLHGSF